MEKYSLYKTSPGDYLLAGFIFISSLSVMFGFKENASSGTKALLYQENKLVDTISLDGVKIETGYFKGRDVHVEIDNGRIRISRADCPLQICRQTGWISNPGRTILCVPNRILIEIQGSGGREYDAVSY